MTIFVTCDCGKSYQLSDDMAGRQGKCPECDRTFEIPAAELPSVEVAPSGAPDFGAQETLNSWNDVRAFLLREFADGIQEDSEESVQIVLGFQDGRSQFVVVSLVRAVNGDEWMSIKSPVGLLPTEILPRICETVHDKVCGGIIKYGDRYWLRHSLPIGNISHDEIKTPLWVVGGVADDLEDTFVGGDAQ